MKMMIVCPHFRDIEYGIIESFNRLGVKVYPFFFSVGMDKWHYIQRFKNKLGFNVDKFLNKEKFKFNKRLLIEFNKINPDIVYVIQGRWMDVETIKYMKKSAFIALYLWDMVSLFPEMIDSFVEYNIIYSFDQQDTNFLKKKGYNVKFKPSGYDNSVYYPMFVEKEYDIAFVGAMYPERVLILDELIKTFPNLKWMIYGEYAPTRKPLHWLKWFLSDRRKYYKNKNIEKEKVNELYNKSRIVLSIVRDNQKDGWSSRLTEILGTSSFQLTNYFSSVEKEFSNCLVMYKNLDELKLLIEFYLVHNEKRDKISKNGYTKAKNKYADDIINQVIIDDYKIWLSHMGLCEEK